MFYIQNAKNLPSMDWWNGLADPYVIITAHVGGQQFQYKCVSPGLQLSDMARVASPCDLHEHVGQQWFMYQPANPIAAAVRDWPKDA
jgi:hypothetical protein